MEKDNINTNQKENCINFKRKSIVAILISKTVISDKKLQEIMIKGSVH